MKTNKLILYFIFTCGTSTYARSQNIDSLFVNWNTETIKSIQLQIDFPLDSSKVERYKETILSIQGYWRITTLSAVNANSIRYKFLNQIVKRDPQLSGKRFYIIEANESGSKVLLRSFIVITDSSNLSSVAYYSYYHDLWHKSGNCSLSKFGFEKDLKQYLIKKKGINYDNIIITEINDNKIVTSEFYSYSTLAPTSRIDLLLDCYQKTMELKGTEQINQQKMINQ